MHFRPGTVDEDTWNSILSGNEYGLPNTLPETELILDVGTHVGSFVQACWNRGSRNIVSFEPNDDNFKIATFHVGHLPGVTLFHNAVGAEDGVVSFSGYPQFFDGRVNTGGGHTLGSGQETVDCKAFDSLFPGQKIILLKLDCEGSEWPILYCSKTLDRVQMIVGEYHSLSSEIEESLDLDYPCNATLLGAFLRTTGFTQVEVQPFNELHAKCHNGQQIGLFRAVR